MEGAGEHRAEGRRACAPGEDASGDLDREMVVNNGKFRCIDHIDALRRRADWPALAAAIRLETAESPP